MVKTDLHTGITIGIPTRHLNWPVTLQWAFAYKSLVPPINFNMVTATIQGKPVHLSRNEIVAHALREGHKFLFFLGDDVVVPHNILKKLIYRAEQNKDHGVITGVYCSKSDPASPLLFRGNGVGAYWDWKVGEYFEVTGCGMDAVLIRMDVFRELIPHVGRDEQGNYQFFKTVEEDKFEDGINSANMWTEDLYFLKRVTDHTQFKIYCDGSMLCDHVDVHTGKVYRLPADSNPITGIDKHRAENRKKGIDLGCGPFHMPFPPEYHVVRVDIRDDCNPDYRCDVRDLPFANETFDFVFSSHVLEHFGRWEWEKVLGEWIRLLKKDGVLKLILPNINWAIEKFKDGTALHEENQVHVFNVLYGGQSNPYDFHYNGWTKETLEAALRKFGFTRFKWMEEGYNMFVDAMREVEVENGVQEESNQETSKEDEVLNEKN